MNTENKFQLNCKRCKKNFTSYKLALTGELPKNCPNCKSPYWNKEYRVIGDNIVNK